MGTEEEKSLLGSSSWLCKSPFHGFAFTQSSWEEEEEEEEAEAEDISDAVLVKRLESSAISVACYESWREQLSDSPSQNMCQDDGEVRLDNFCPLSQGYQKMGDATVTHEDPYAAAAVVEWFNNKEFHGGIFGVHIAEAKNKDAGVLAHAGTNGLTGDAVFGGDGGLESRGRGWGQRRTWQEVLAIERKKEDKASYGIRIGLQHLPDEERKKEDKASYGIRTGLQHLPDEERKKESAMVKEPPTICEELARNFHVLHGQWRIDQEQHWVCKKTLIRDIKDLFMPLMAFIADLVDYRHSCNVQESPSDCNRHPWSYGIAVCGGPLWNEGATPGGSLLSDASSALFS